MRTLIAVMLLMVLVSTVCPAQETDRQAYLLCMARALSAIMDVELLSKIAPLKLTDSQLQALAALYEQYGFKTPDLATARAAADQVEAVRQRLIVGEQFKPFEEQALQQALQTAFTQFAGPGAEWGKPVTELKPEEKLAWGLLTPEQQGTLVGGGNPQEASMRAMQIIAQSRAAEEEAWVQTRDRLAASLSAAAGADGTPARENSRRMFLDFLNRIRDMTPADFAAKQAELSGELTALLPPGTNLAAALSIVDLASIRQALWQSLLNPRAPGLLKEMEAARAKAGG